MTSAMNSCTESGFHRGLSGLLPLVVAIALWAVGCTRCDEARRGAESVHGGIHVGPGSVRTLLSNEELQIVGTHISPTASAEFTADGKWIVVSGTDGVTIHDAVSTKCVNWFNGELVETSPDGASFLLGYPSGAPELRSIPDGALIWRLPNDVVAHPMHFSDDGLYIVCGYRNLLRIETKEAVYQAPNSYRYDTFGGDDRYGNPADDPQRDDAEEDALPGSLSALPYIYRETLRHDARPLITPKSRRCSPAGQFMAVQTGEEDSSYDPYYSFIHRKTGERLFSDVPSLNALFFHNDAFVFHGGRVYRTEGREIRYALAGGITSFALNSEETMLAVGWHNGEVAVLDPLSGEEFFRAKIEEHHDTKRQKSGDIVSLAFSNDSKRLAAVGRKLTLIDVPSQTVSDVLHLGRGSREVAGPETTSPAEIAFNADDSRLLLTGRQGDEYIYSRARVHVLHATDLKRRRALVSPDFFDRIQKILPVYFNSDGTWAIVPADGRGSRADRLQLWDTRADHPFANIAPHVFDWWYRRRFIVPDFPKRHLGSGCFRRWHSDEIVLDPWSVESIESANEKELPHDAKAWLETFVRVNPQNRYRGINGPALDLPSRKWRLRFTNNRIRRLHDLSTGATYPPRVEELNHEQAQELDKIDVPESCWGLAGVEANAFFSDGSRLLVYSRRYRAESEHLLALYEMPSGKLVRNYEGHAYIRRIHIAPNSRVAAISTDFYRRTWIIDVETGETLVELPKGGKCVFSPDSRYAQVGDRYGESRSLLAIESGNLLDFEWADRWAFSPNSRYAVGGSGRSWFFIDLATGERTEIPGDVHRTGMQTLSTTELDLPYQGNRFLCVDKGDVTLFDVNAMAPLATFNPTEIAEQSATGHDKTPATYAPTGSFRFLYTPDDRDFVYVVEGSGVEEDSANDESLSVLANEAQQHSTQVFVVDLKTGERIECGAPNWGRSPLQHRLFTPEGEHVVTISSDKMVCWKLRPLRIAWGTRLSDRWTDPETGEPFARDDTLRWSLDYMIHPSDQSILIAADGREAILFDLATGEERRRFGPLPINAVLRFGSDGAYLQAGFRSNQSMNLYSVSSGELVKTYHFTTEGAKLHRFDSVDAQ